MYNYLLVGSLVCSLGFDLFCFFVNAEVKFFLELVAESRLPAKFEELFLPNNIHFSLIHIYYSNKDEILKSMSKKYIQIKIQTYLSQIRIICYIISSNYITVQ